MPIERWPNFFIVGVQKSGTSALASWLGGHPQIYMSFPKEPGYMAFQGAGYTFKDGYGNLAPAHEYVVADEKSYLGLFADAGKDVRILGEASTWYFAIPGVAQRIARYSPDARIVVILRDPADRAYSAWCHARRDRLEPLSDFNEALAAEENRRDMEFLLRYRWMSMYSENLKRYQSVFEPSQLMVLTHDELSSESKPLWQRLCNFLDVDANCPIPRQTRVNVSGQPRLPLLQQVIKSYRFRSAVLKLLPRQKAVKIKSWVDELNLKKVAPLDPGTREMLQDYFRPDIEEVSSLTGLDLKHWLH